MVLICFYILGSVIVSLNNEMVFHVNRLAISIKRAVLRVHTHRGHITASERSKSDFSGQIYLSFSQRDNHHRLLFVRLIVCKYHIIDYKYILGTV